MYISECVGVAFVGVSVIIWGLSSCLGSFLSGWLIHYTTSSVSVTTVIGLGHVGSAVFLLVWVRQPSLVVICTMAAVYGLCHGVIFQTALGKCTYTHSSLTSLYIVRVKLCALVQVTYVIHIVR